MAIAVQSTANTTWTNAASLTITKPTGLAEGDLLVACLIAESEDWTVPSGWTEYVDLDNNWYLSLMYKVADSSDVAASNFTFTPASSDDVCGALLRVDGYAPTALFSDAETEVDANSATQYNWGVTIDPITDGELIIVIGAASQTNGANSVSSPAINGTNPTWTEVLDTYFDEGGGDGANGYVAYAIQTTQAQITSFTATLAAAQASTDGYGIIATLSPQTNATVNLTPLQTTSAHPNISGGATHDLTLLTTTTAMPNVTTSTQTKRWTGEDKSTRPTWTGETKS